MNIGYYILYPIAYAFSLLPYKVLYCFSDFFFLLVYHLIGYRRTIVKKNLTTSFPEKTDDEIKRIERDFYHWLCDYFVETLKLLSVSRSTLKKHFEFRNLELLEQYFDKGQSCAAMLGHYCNWEYLSATKIYFQRWEQKAVLGLIYHPLRNKTVDRLFFRLREHQGGEPIAKQDILRRLVALRRENRRTIFGYILDQSPKWENIHLWLPFMNHDTAVFTGAERITRKMQDAVVYVDLERPRRGLYVCTLHLITDRPQDLPPNELTRLSFEWLEKSIRRAPQYYLWTHNRWKRTHEEYDRLVYEGKLKAR